MAKLAGLGANAYVGGYDLSGDIGAVQNVQGGPNLLIVTAIDKSAEERVTGIKSGSLQFASWFNPSALQQHVAFSPLPTTDVVSMFAMKAGASFAIGDECAQIIGKQVDYQANRQQDGSLAFTIDMQSNGWGLEWGNLLTAGKRTDGSATNGTSWDDLAGAPTSTAFGMSAYAELFAFSGTSVTITVQDSADNVSFAAITGLAFPAWSSAPQAARQSTSSTATIRRYLRVATSGTFSNAVFAVSVTRHLTATL